MNPSGPARPPRSSAVARRLAVGCAAPWWRLVGLLASLWLGGAAPPLAAQEQAWQYAPYRMQVWLAAESAPELTPGVLAAIDLTLRERADAIAGAAWSITLEPAPAEFVGMFVQELATLGPPHTELLGEERLDALDKIVPVVVRVELDRIVIESRELDCRTRRWGPLVRRETPYLSLAPETAWRALSAAFTPLLRLGRKEEELVVAELRAGGLVRRDDSPVRLAPGDVLQPIIRHNERTGQPRPGGIQAMDWTFLVVDSVDELKVNCQIHSGVRNSIGTRGSRRTERLALAVKSDPLPSVLTLRTRAVEPRMLSDYEIYARDPRGEEKLELLGRSNWRGEVEIPPGEYPLRVLYVKSGQKLLARLPVVPGLAPKLTAELPDDSRRLEAEGFIAGVEAQIMDLMAFRAILAASIRRELEAGEVAKAEELLVRFRSLPTRLDLSRDVEQQQRRIISADRSQQAQIDRVFTEARTLLGAVLDVDEAGRLAVEIAQAKSGARPAATATAPRAAPAPTTPTPPPTPPTAGSGNEPAASGSEPATTTSAADGGANADSNASSGAADNSSPPDDS